MKSEDNINLYKPGDADESDNSVEAAKNRATSDITWTASEYIEHQRGASWYLMLALVTAALAAGIYLLTKDYFATGTIAVLGVIVGVFVGRKPAQVTFELSGAGLKAGEKTYSYNLFKSFSVIREGTLTSLNLTPVKRFMPPVSAYFEPKDEEKIVNLIGEHLPYEERKPAAIDRLSRRLKL